MFLGMVEARSVNVKKTTTNSIIIVFLRKIRTHLLEDLLLSIPQSRGKNVKTFRWDHRLQIQNLFVAFKRVVAFAFFVTN